MKLKFSAVAALAVGGLFASAAYAGPADDLTVTYTNVVVAVPLSPWMMAALGIALAGAAAVFMRKRGMGQGVSFALMAMICVAGLGVAHQVHAIGATPASLSLTGSGTASGNYTDQEIEVTVTNNSASSVSLTGITHNSRYGKSPTLPSSCAVGTVLEPASACIYNMYMLG